MHIEWQSCLPPKLLFGQVHIWRAFLSNASNKLSYYWEKLSKDEKIYADQFYFATDRIRYIVARGGLRSILSKYNRLSPQSLQFQYSEHGKPSLLEEQNQEAIHFNLSHSKDCVVYAVVRNTTVGVDVEYYNSNFQWEELISTYFVEQECNRAKEIPLNKKNEYFYSLWTVKEALVKALEIGLLCDLKQFRVDLDLKKNDCTVHFLREKDSPPSLQWTLQLFKPSPHYCAAFATHPVVKNFLYLDMDSVLI
jgi:4'-phosphopantetheinyl transferase